MLDEKINIIECVNLNSNIEIHKLKDHTFSSHGDYEFKF